MQIGRPILQKLKKGVVVAHIDECRHAIVIKDMCGSCGKDLREFRLAMTCNDILMSSYREISNIKKYFI